MTETLAAASGSFLKRSAGMLPIPGTSSVAHVEENTAAARIALSDKDFAALAQAAGWLVGRGLSRSDIG